MKTIVIALASVMFAAQPAFADDKPSKEEATKIEAALAEWGCGGGELEKEDSGIFEIDDAKCKAGQYDIKLDEKFGVISMTRD